MGLYFGTNPGIIDITFRIIINSKRSAIYITAFIRMIINSKLSALYIAASINYLFAPPRNGAGRCPHSPYGALLSFVPYTLRKSK